MRRRVPAALACAALVACGGGGGGEPLTEAEAEDLVGVAIDAAVESWDGEEVPEEDSDLAAVEAMFDCAFADEGDDLAALADAHVDVRRPNGGRSITLVAAAFDGDPSGAVDAADDDTVLACIEEALRTSLEEEGVEVAFDPFADPRDIGGADAAVLIDLHGEANDVRFEAEAGMVAVDGVLVGFAALGPLDSVVKRACIELLEALVSELVAARAE